MPDVITDGLKHDGGKARLDLVPPEIIQAVGVVLIKTLGNFGICGVIFRNIGRS